MSRNKIALSFALAGILGASTALAETDGAFVGVQAGYGTAKFKNENKYNEYNDYTGESKSGEMSGSVKASAFRYGFVAGYKQFFTPEFGARYYASVDLGADYKKDYTDENGDDTIKWSSYNVSANVDALYNFISSDELDFGVFAGVSLGYASHKLDLTGRDAEPDNVGASGFDLGINFGLRTNIAQNHGIELYSRFGVLQQKKEISGAFDYNYDGSVIKNSYKITPNFQQLYQVGLRYVFSF